MFKYIQPKIIGAKFLIILWRFYIHTHRSIEFNWLPRTPIYVCSVARDGVQFSARSLVFFSFHIGTSVKRHSGGINYVQRCHFGLQISVSTCSLKNVVEQIQELQCFIVTILLYTRFGRFHSSASTTRATLYYNFAFPFLLSVYHYSVILIIYIKASTKKK